MGRTVPTYRMASESLFQSWSDFRRALPQEDRAAFDRLSDKVRMHASACTVAAFLDPLEGALLSILLEQEKELERLRKKA
ncbi:MAG TPA: hypothetical protein PKO24_05350 [Methanomassiliicoccales archaeon]|nr:hypothetical protein [Euryarchaeota archaeon]HOE53040.1 hypothetical protein [Methanomassiliicoccales archaeon]HOO03197.1 hypothetical protein [Methanomassiliicoccales archaeon]HQM66229.1 hypothetical protein [Methanomassiliicoccales archaeon]HRR67130.1 hypothetical protein [Methanomassiliicoccales archaeon]